MAIDRSLQRTRISSELFKRSFPEKIRRKTCFCSEGLLRASRPNNKTTCPEFTRARPPFTSRPISSIWIVFAFSLHLRVMYT